VKAHNPVVRIFSSDKMQAVRWVAGVGKNGEFPIVIGEQQRPGDD